MLFDVRGCVDGELDGSWGAAGTFTCDTYSSLYGTGYCVYGEIALKCCHCGGGTPSAVSPTVSPTRSPTRSPTWTPTSSPTPAPTRLPTRLPTSTPTLGPTPAPSSAPISTTTTTASCVDGALKSAWSLDLHFTCDMYSDLIDTAFAAFCVHEELAKKCCHCGGGTDPSASTTSSGSCVDGELNTSWGSDGNWTNHTLNASWISGGNWTNDTLNTSRSSGDYWTDVLTCDMLYNLNDSAYCVYEEIAQQCCYCGGGRDSESQTPTPVATSDPTPAPTWLPTFAPTSTPVSTTTTVSCVDGALNLAWSLGGNLTCDMYYGLIDTAFTAFCVHEEVAHKCCHCGGGAVIMDDNATSTTFTSPPTAAPTLAYTSTPTSGLNTSNTTETNTATSDCVDGELDASGISDGNWTCGTYYGQIDSALCVYEEIAQKCCHCGGGSVVMNDTTTSTTFTTSAIASNTTVVSGSCVDGTLNRAWSTGSYWDCDTFLGLSDSFCVHEEIAQKCCQCGGVPGVVSSAVLPSVVALAMTGFVM